MSIQSVWYSFRQILASKPTRVILIVFSSVLLISVVSVSSTTDSAIPIVGTEDAVFSLDAEYTGTTDIGVVYALEYRGNPNYRILEIDTAQQSINEVFNVPEGGLVYGMAVNQTRSMLAIGLTLDFSSAGNGIYLLDLNNQEAGLRELIVDESDAYYFDFEWGSQDMLLATKTSLNQEVNSVISIDTASGSVRELVEDGIDPVYMDGVIAYLPLEADSSRRSIGTIDTANLRSTVDVLDKEYDLDNVVYDASKNQIMVSALNRSGGLSINFGAPVYAHGNHSVPSSWVVLSGDDYSVVADSELESKLVYDATVSQDGTLIESTNEGLYISNQAERELVVKSRALRFIAY